MLVPKFFSVANFLSVAFLVLRDYLQFLLEVLADLASAAGNRELPPLMHPLVKKFTDIYPNVRGPPPGLVVRKISWIKLASFPQTVLI